MRLYLHSDRAEKSKTYIVNLAPAADPGIMLEGQPADWKNPDGSAKQMQVEFVYGVAEQVPDDLAKYMIERGIAHKSRLLRKIAQLFDRDGKPIDEVFDARGQRINLDTSVMA